MNYLAIENCIKSIRNELSEEKMKLADEYNIDQIQLCYKPSYTYTMEVVFMGLVFKEIQILFPQIVCHMKNLHRETLSSGMQEFWYVPYIKKVEHGDIAKLKDNIFPTYLLDEDLVAQNVIKDHKKSE